MDSAFASFDLLEVPLVQAGGIFLAAVFCEDLTCIAVGLLLGGGRVGGVVGLGACLAGILASDAGLWLLGRLGRRWGWLRDRLAGPRLGAARDWLVRHGGKAVFLSRFLPGTRIPVVLAAGLSGLAAWRFWGWLLLAVLLWTPGVVLGVALCGEVVAGPLRRLAGSGWVVPVALAGVVAVSGVRARSASRRG